MSRGLGQVLRLLAVVLAAPAQTACVRDITTAAGLAQPMVSHHLQILHRAALVTLSLIHI